MHSHTLLTTIILGTLISQGFTKPMALDNSSGGDANSVEEEEEEGEEGPGNGLGNPDEQGDGDMRLGEDLMGPPDGKGPLFRNVIHKNYWEDYLWTDGIVPFEFQEHGYFAVDDITRNVTLEAIKWLNEQTAIFGKPCLQIRPWTESDSDFLRFESRIGCYADVAKRGRAQIVSLGPGCAKRGVVAHEILHALGFYHEQSRTDRDNYVSVYLENVKQGNEKNFDKTEKPFITDTELTDYDFDSIMHYSAYAFNKERGLKTIVPKDDKLPRGVLMGQRTHLSANDLKEIRNVYGCTGPKGETYEDNIKRGSGGSKNKVTDTKNGGRTKSETKEKGGSQAKKIKSKNTAQSKTKEDEEAFSTYCDFESSSSCKFSKDTSLDFGWTRSSGETDTSNTGPSRDHTKGNKKGYYYYAEATGHAGKVGGTLSPKIPPGTYCLDFWYHMYGSQVGDFKVFLVEQGKKDRSKLWRASGNQGDDWINQKMSIRAAKPSVVAFAAEMKKNGDKGDVAIDDVRITSGPCK